MEKCLNQKVVINGVNKTAHYCSDCEKLLDIDDYIFGDSMCNICRSKHYSRTSTKYIDVGGVNKVDEILLAKRERS